MRYQNYLLQKQHWPQAGKHIMAQYDKDSVVVYQAYRPVIGHFAAKHQYFGGDFKYSRMSWIKPNVLWMMYRSGWGSKAGQEVVLAITLYRDYFDRILQNAYPSTCPSDMEYDVWKSRIATSSVRLQWDPDHDPFGNKVERRAIQLGLRNDFLLPFKGEGIAKIEDISSFVEEQFCILSRDGQGSIETPLEAPYPVNEKIANNLGMNL